MMTKTFARPLLMAAVAGLALAGCSRSDREETETVNDTVVTEVPAAEPLPEPAPLPTPTVEANLAEPLPEASPEEPDAQMMDDASATGMTARAARDDGTPADRE